MVQVFRHISTLTLAIRPKADLALGPKPPRHGETEGQ